MKTLKVIGKITCIILVSVIALFLLVWGGLHVAKFILYPDYYAQGEQISKIPALSKGFIPQGLDYDPKTDTYIHSGYNGKNIELYLVNGDTVRKIVLLTVEGKQAKGHAGGVSIVGDYIYIADNSGNGDGLAREGFLRVYYAADILNAKNGDSIREIERVNVGVPASFCFSNDDYIYVGEFYRAESHKTPKSHHFTTPSGDENKALLLAYPLGADGSITKNTQPEFALSITSFVQGLAVTENGSVMLSRSWSLTNSHIEFHTGWKDSGKQITIDGTNLPLYYLDSSTMRKDLILPSFGESLALIDDKVAISFESACNKYVIGKFFFANKVMAFSID